MPPGRSGIGAVAGRTVRGMGLVSATAIRCWACSSSGGRTRRRPATVAHTMASTVTASGAASHSRILMAPAYETDRSRGCGHALRRADPFLRTVGEALMLPDRHARLELVDQPAARRERLVPVRCAGADDDRHVPDSKVTHAVQRGHS